MSLVLRGATVVDPLTGNKTTGRDVLVEGDRISAIADKGSLQADQVVDATGKFLLPGFLDMHAHPTELKDPSGALALMLSYGITGFRQMSGNDALLADGKLPADSPALLARPGDLLTPLNAGTPQKATAAVRHQHEKGADFIKAALTTAPAFAAAQTEANRLGIPILGHLPANADVPRISGAGMRSIEHLGGGTGLLACCSSLQPQVEAATAKRPEIKIPGFLVPLVTPLFAKVILPRLVVNPTGILKDPDVEIYQLAVGSFDEDAAARVAAMLKANGTWQVPTLIRTKTMMRASDSAFATDPDLRYIDPKALKLWQNAAAKHGARSAEQRATLALTSAVLQRLVKIMDDAGVRMLTGSDATGAGWVVPGASLHHEFDELAAAGLSPLRILQMATCDAAEFLGKPDLGAVEIGKSAELVLLGSDPTASVDGLHDIAGVLRAGRWYDTSALTTLRERVATARSAA